MVYLVPHSIGIENVVLNKYTATTQGGWSLFAVDASGRFVAAAEGAAGGDGAAEIEPFLLGDGFAEDEMALPRLRYHDQGVAALEFLAPFGDAAVRVALGVKIILTPPCTFH